MPELKLNFPADHPCGVGHFPGNPIIPGALLLDEVLASIGASLAINGAAWHVKAAKFPQPARPGDAVHINYTQAPNGEIRFECTVSGNVVLSGIASSHTIVTESLSL